MQIRKKLVAAAGLALVAGGAAAAGPADAHMLYSQTQYEAMNLNIINTYQCGHLTLGGRASRTTRTSRSARAPLGAICRWVTATATTSTRSGSRLPLAAAVAPAA